MISMSTCAWIWKKAKHLRGIIVVLITLEILLSLTSILFIYTSKSIIDAALNNDGQALTRSLWQLAIIILFQLIFRVFLPTIEEDLRAKIETNLRYDLADLLLKKSYTQVNQYHTGEWLTHFFSDIETITEGLISLVSIFFKRGAELVFALILLASLAPAFLVAVLLGGLVLFLFSSFLRRRVKPLFKQVQQKKALVQAYLQEQIEHFVIVKSFQAEQFSLEKLAERQKTYLAARRYRQRLVVLAGSSFVFGYQFAYFIAIFFGARGIYQGKLTYGSLTAIIQLVSQVMIPIAAISGSISSFFAMLVSSERLMVLEKGLPIPKESLPFTKANRLVELEFSEISFSREGKTVFKDSSFSLRPGEIVALLGKSGIGKTTLFHVLLGLYPLDSGEIYAHIEKDGQLVSYPLSRYDFSSLFSYVSQGKTLFSGTIRDNFLLAKPTASDEEIWKALHLVYADQFVSDLEQGLDTVLLENGKNLSEGQGQRLVIARALLTDKPVVLYDEMTSALDGQAEQIFLDNLVQMTDRLSFVISHKISTQKICQRQLELVSQQLKEVTHV